MFINWCTNIRDQESCDIKGPSLMIPRRWSGQDHGRRLTDRQLMGFLFNECLKPRSSETLCPHLSLTRPSVVLWFVCIVLEHVCLWPCCSRGRVIPRICWLSTILSSPRRVCPARRVNAPSSGSIKCPPPDPFILREQLKIVLWRACPHNFQLLYCSASASVSIDRRLGLTNILKWPAIPSMD